MSEITASKRPKKTLHSWLEKELHKIRQKEEELRARKVKVMEELRKEEIGSGKGA